jgi:tRNA-2-methylthio-N6-dimethylallyladenosine synthase
VQLSGLKYSLRTFGCQMNKHDSERVAGMLDALGCEPFDAAVASSSPAQASGASTPPDIIIFMTCCVREAADTRLLGQVASLKNSAPSAVICVGGCIGQRDGAKLIEQLPHIDVVFGTHNVAHLPQLITAVLEGRGAQVEVLAAAQTTSDLPAHREQAWHGWVSIMTGCNNFCTYCVVPYVRGRESSRPLESVLDEVKALVASGVQEITLLGQNVNSYGRDLYGEPRFAELLAAVAQSGVPRLRFTTSHPKDLSPETIEVFANEPAVMPHLHLPVQSGSNSIIKAMNRHYTVEHYLDLIRSVREACAASGKGEVAFSTDLIVGFPGESAPDFEATLELVRQVGYAQAFTFIYSKREGTPAAEMVDDTPREVIQERFDRLVALVQQTAFDSNQADLGSALPVLFEGSSKRDAQVLAGKSPKQQTVHALLPTGKTAADYTGKILPVKITEAKTWYLKGELV